MKISNRGQLRRTFYQALGGCCLLAVMTFTVRAQPLTFFDPLAGPAGGPGTSDGTSSAARFNTPARVATDGSGNIYVADTFNHTIRKVTPAGVVTTLAGSAGLAGSADGVGSTARFNDPAAVAIDGGGNVYVADTFNFTIRKITPAGVVTTLAGSPGFNGSNDGTGSAARFANPAGVATDSSGNLYVGDIFNNTVRKITPAGAVTTLAGSAGLAGNADGTGSTARFHSPSAVATDSSGNVYVTDTFNHTIRKITQAGMVTTLAGSAGVAGSADGTASVARFNKPAGIATDSDGNVYVADTFNHTIRKITPGGVVTTVAGSAGLDGSVNGTASSARFNEPSGVATDSAGNIYVADQLNHAIRKISFAGTVTTLAGLAGGSGSADGIASSALFKNPTAVAADSGRNLYVADQLNHTIRKITPAPIYDGVGTVTTLAGSAGINGSADGIGSDARFNNPSGVATDNGGNVFVADTGNQTIRKINSTGVVTTLAGSAGVVGSADGTGSTALFNRPFGLAADNGGNVYVADQGNQLIRKITPAGVVTTLAGSAGINGSADGTGSTARFAKPSGVAIDSGGNVYVADSGNHTIRKITPAGTVTTLAGSAGLDGSADGAGSAARFNNPAAVSTDGDGNVYVADAGNHTIRKIIPVGIVTTVAGSAGLSASVDGTGSVARFSGPSGVTADSAGNVYVADTLNNKIRLGRPALADAATIDFSIGIVGTARQLDTTAQTALSWQWSIVRQPSGSMATLSSISIRNPLFIPDVADVYVFQLTATNGLNASITTVSLTATTSVNRRRRAVRSEP